ncbi:hypothetical protein AURDEDRAFT_183788 [Auricularia subglabra TFB-10046 SS5]|nr:hypothetical protein AURDEDRAFT_183788 [Auricularia subglabra TFB-10046 SS5]
MQPEGWKEEGAGWLELNEDLAYPSRARIVMSDTMSERVILDEALYTGMPVEVNEDTRTVTFGGRPGSDGQVPMYTLRVTNVQFALEAHAAIKEKVTPKVVEKPKEEDPNVPKDDEEEEPESKLKLTNRDTEDAVHRVRAIVFVQPLEDVPNGLPETEEGTGWLTVNVNKSNKSVARIVVYDEKKDRVILDEPLYPGMEIEVLDRQRTIKFAAEERDGQKNFVTMRVPSPKMARAAHAAMIDRIPTTRPDPDWEDPIAAVAKSLKMWKKPLTGWSMTRLSCIQVECASAWPTGVFTADMVMDGRKA